jgi:protein O-mannosyl-transferase
VIRSLRQYALRSFPYVVLVLWTIFLYFPSVSQPFVYDDQFQIVNNPPIREFRLAVNYFRTPIAFHSEFETNSGAFYRPLFWMSLAADSRNWNLKAEGFHATNIALHVLNGILIFMLFRRVLPRVVALVAALAWLSLPIHSEVVAWISGRGLSLATFFILLAVLSTLKYAQRANAILLVLIGLSSACALLSHEGGIVVCPVVMLAAACSLSSNNRMRSLGYVLSATGVPFVVYTLLRVAVLHSGAPSMNPLPEIALRAPVTIAKYVWWTIHAPAMSMERSTELAGLNFSSQLYALAWLTLIAITGLSLWLRRSIPLLAFGMAAAVLSLLPFIQILPLYQAVAERYVYAASIGIVLAIVAVLSVLVTRLRLPQWTTIGLLCLWIAFSVVPLRARIRAWSSERLLYTTSLRASPRSYVLYQNLGVLEQGLGKTQTAIAYYSQALSLRASYRTARKNLGNLYLREGRLPEALQEFTELMKSGPDDLEVQLNVGTILLVQGQTDAAIAVLRDLVAKHPDSYQGQLNLGVALFSKYDPAARTHLETAFRLKPDSPEVALNMGMLEEAAGNIEEARKFYERAIYFRPGYAKAAEQLRRLQGQERAR